LLAVAYCHDYAPLERDRVWAGLCTEEVIEIVAYHPQPLLCHVVPCANGDPDGYGEQHSTSGDLGAHRSGIVEGVGIWPQGGTEGCTPQRVKPLNTWDMEWGEW